MPRAKNTKLDPKVRLIRKIRPNKRREAFKTLWALSKDLSPPPKKFEKDKVYRIKITGPVTPSGHHFPFRPSQDIQVRGDVAEEIREFISGAKLIG